MVLRRNGMLLSHFKRNRDTIPPQALAVPLSVQKLKAPRLFGQLNRPKEKLKYSS
jgi:hypothetical protein